MQNNITQPAGVNNAYQNPPANSYIQPQINNNVGPMQTPPAVQNSAPPNYAGVNIQIFNPSVATPGAQAPTYNVNAPSYPAGPSSYGAGYYTQNYGQGQNGMNGANGGGLMYGPNGVPININNTNTNNGCGGTGDGSNGNNNGLGANGQSNGVNSSQSTETNKKTEKRNIVVLTDDYIRNLENYLNSQDKEVRLMGAKEVIARLEEDDSRKDDKALNALVNKMLQDPSQQIRILALAALDSRSASGDAYTVQVLKNMQSATTGYGQDALQASNILLKMSGQTAEKEFEVKETKKSETKTESKSGQ
ncbi:hypothetical protein J6E39_06475 [bacterium]|nr:hypothetical protein [bacterium]